MVLAVDRRRLGIVAAVTLVLSLRILLQPGLFDFFSPLDVFHAWIEHVLELAAIAMVLLAAYTLVDERLARQARLRLLAIWIALLVAATVVTSLIALHVVGELPAFLWLLSGALRVAVPALLLAALEDLYRRAARSDLALREAEGARERLEREETEHHLHVLQAQLEPHFLFNTLANVRRLYRTDPASGARAISSLKHYLGAALPQLRRETARLEDEIDLVRAYLELFRMRMGGRLTFSVQVDSGLLEAEFPPMLLMTLVENAVKHGLEPLREGGHVAVAVRTRGANLEATITDNGVGFDGAGGSGTGVGLVNVRRQLLARYDGAARLELAAASPRGALAAIVVPLRLASPSTASSAIAWAP